MKMAKANEADLEMAMELTGMLDVLGHQHYPSMPTVIARNDGDEDFDRDDDDQCGRALRGRLETAVRGSLMRVVWGAAVMLDPRNKLVDPYACTIEAHPDTEAAFKDAARLRWLLEDHDTDTRQRCREILERLPVMGYGAAVQLIDDAMAAPAAVGAV